MTWPISHTELQGGKMFLSQVVVTATWDPDVRALLEPKTSGTWG